MNLKYTSTFSMFCYFLNFTLAQLVLALPLFYARLVGNAGPILSIYIFIIIFIYMFIIYKLYIPFSGKNIFDISKFVGKNVLYKINIILYMIAFFLISFIFLRQISESVKILLFNTSPIMYVTLFFVISMVIGSIYGLEGIVRACGYIVPICTFAILLTLLFSSQFFKFERINPIFGNGYSSIFINGIERITSYIGIIFIFVYASFLKDIKNIKKVSKWYIIASFILMFLCIIANVLIFAYPYLSSNLFSLYELANLTNLNSFFQRTEIPFILSFLLICFIVLISGFEALIYSYKLLVNIKKEKTLLPNFAIGALIFYVSTIPKNLLSVIDIQLFLKDYYLIPTIFIYPLILLIIARIKYSKNRGDYEKFIIDSN